MPKTTTSPLKLAFLFFLFSNKESQILFQLPSHFVSGLEKNSLLTFKKDLTTGMNLHQRQL